MVFPAPSGAVCGPLEPACGVVHGLKQPVAHLVAGGPCPGLPLNALAVEHQLDHRRLLAGAGAAVEEAAGLLVEVGVLGCVVAEAELQLYGLADGGGEHLDLGLGVLAQGVQADLEGDQGQGVGVGPLEVVDDGGPIQAGPAGQSLP